MSVIKERLTALGMSQADLARKSGLSQAYISGLVNGHRGRRMGADAAQRLAKALRVRPLFLLDAFASANIETEEAPVEVGAP